jgi:hypothetical protein
LALLPRFASAAGCGAPKGALAFFGPFIVPTITQRTIVYVDGFNLYYGALRGTRFKWLDLSALFQKVLGSRTQTREDQVFHCSRAADTG